MFQIECQLLFSNLVELRIFLFVNIHLDKINVNGIGMIDANKGAKNSPQLSRSTNINKEKVVTE